MALIGGGRPERFCPLCRQVDDHPRHVKSTDPDDGVAEHMDCCRGRGCLDGSCDVVGEMVGVDLRGGELLGALLAAAGHGLQAKAEERRALFEDTRGSAEILSDADPARTTLLSPDENGG